MKLDNKKYEKIMEYVLILIIFLFVIFITFKPLREGVVFTAFDNYNLLNKPWDDFCTQKLPSCETSKDNYLLGNRDPPIGCWCKNQKSVLDNPGCTDIEYNPYAEYRR